MKNLKTIFCTVVCLMIFLQVDSFAQKNTKTKDVLLFEISRFSNPGGVRRSSESVFYFYQSGRMACKNTSFDPRGKKIESKKIKCFRISKEKVIELTELAEQTDFLEAKNNYRFFAGGVDLRKCRQRLH